MDGRTFKGPSFSVFSVFSVFFSILVYTGGVLLHVDWCISKSSGVFLSHPTLTLGSHIAAKQP